MIGVMMVLLGQPVAAINNGMMNWLSSLQEANPILLGIVVGAMCSFDFGGPVNKAAYVTGTLLLGQGNYFFYGRCICRLHHAAAGHRSGDHVLSERL